jgi:hypothetical protein
MSAIGIIPANIPIDEKGNLINPVWYNFLQQMYIRIGGARSQNNNELIVGQLDDAGIEETKAELYVLRDQIESIAAQVQGMIDDLDVAPMAYQGYDYNPAAVEITGGSIDGVAIGNISPATGKFTDITNGNIAALIKTSVNMNNGAGAMAGTLLNAPTAGNPAKWVPINDNGTVRYVPTWV